MRKDYKYIITTIIVLLVFYFAIKIHSDNHFKKYGIESVCYTTEYSVMSKDKSVKFFFFVDGKKRTGERRIGNQKVLLNTYYEMVYSKVDYAKTRVDFNSRVNDTVLIKKAGFELK